MSAQPARPLGAPGVRVVVRFADGRLLKGTTNDFAPTKDTFHVQEEGSAGKATAVPAGELKALFYVKSYRGDPEHHEDYDFGRVRGHGRKARVVFDDGEVIAGYTMGYHADKLGFFLVPAEENSNNSRIFVVNAHVDRIDWE